MRLVSSPDHTRDIQILFIDISLYFADLESCLSVMFHQRLIEISIRLWPIHYRFHYEKITWDDLSRIDQRQYYDPSKANLIRAKELNLKEYAYDSEKRPWPLPVSCLSISVFPFPVLLLFCKTSAQRSEGIWHLCSNARSHLASPRLKQSP